MKAAFKYFFIWLFLTIVGGAMFFMVAFIVMGIFGYDIDSFELVFENPGLIAGALLTINLLVLLVFWMRKYTRFSFGYGFTYGEKFSSGQLYLWAAVGAVGCLILDIMVQEYVPIPVDEDLGKIFGGLMTNPFGILGICLIGPLAEEVIFRGAILRRLLEKHWNPWFAIVISALFFAVAHGNYAQGFTALVIGIFMGWVFYRTRSIWPCFFIHALNNTAATVISCALPESLENSLGVPLSVGIPLIAVSIFLIAIGARFISRMTDDRTPVPVPAAQVLPPPLPYEATQGYVSPQGPESDVPVEGIPVEDTMTGAAPAEPGESMPPESE